MTDRKQEHTPDGINAELLACCERALAIDERKLASVRKRPYAIGVSIIQERVDQARAAINKAKGKA